MATALLAIAGVLRADTGETIPAGLRLYHALSTQYRLVLLSDGGLAMDEHWLLTHKLREHAEVLGELPTITGQTLRERQIEVARTHGSVDLLVEANPSVAAKALAMGVAILLQSTPKYARPEFRPDGARRVRRWDELTAELDRQAELLATDRRLIEE